MFPYFSSRADYCLKSPKYEYKPSDNMKQVKIQHIKAPSTEMKEVRNSHWHYLIWKGSQSHL